MFMASIEGPNVREDTYKQWKHLSNTKNHMLK